MLLELTGVERKGVGKKWGGYLLKRMFLVGPTGVLGGGSLRLAMRRL